MLVAGLKRYSTLIKHLKPRYIYFYRKKRLLGRKIKINKSNERTNNISVEKITQQT